jgi:hypothetical protein
MSATTLTGKISLEAKLLIKKKRNRLNQRLRNVIPKILICKGRNKTNLS